MAEVVKINMFIRCSFPSVNAKIRGSRLGTSSRGILAARIPGLSGNVVLKSWIRDGAVEVPNSPDAIAEVILELSQLASTSSSDQNFCFPVTPDEDVSTISMSVSTAPAMEHEAHATILVVGDSSRPERVAGAIVKVLSRDSAAAPVVCIEAPGDSALHIALNGICMARYVL